eukprot:m.59074 g.59074  ORF g.59074 m.59074 type:complete len:108 (-) comp13203_c1_seq4:55-378(-)
MEKKTHHQGRLLSFQKLAHASGLAYLNPSCYLCIHPEFGPWISFRAVVVLDTPAPTNLEQQIPQNPCSPDEEACMKTALEEAIAASKASSRRCKPSTPFADNAFSTP